MFWYRLLVVCLGILISSGVLSYWITQRVSVPPVGGARSFSGYVDLYDQYFQDASLPVPAYQQRVWLLSTWAYTANLLMQNKVEQAHDIWLQSYPHIRTSTIRGGLSGYAPILDDRNLHVSEQYCDYLDQQEKIYKHDLIVRNNSILDRLEQWYVDALPQLLSSPQLQSSCVDAWNALIQERKNDIGMSVERLQDMNSHSGSESECHVDTVQAMSVDHQAPSRKQLYAQTYQREKEMSQWFASHIVSYVGHWCQQDKNQQFSAGKQSDSISGQVSSQPSSENNNTESIGSGAELYQERIDTIHEQFDAIHSSGSGFDARINTSSSSRVLQEGER